MTRVWIGLLSLASVVLGPAPVAAQTFLDTPESNAAVARSNNVTVALWKP